MTPIPLDQIGLRWRDHKSALWWLGLLYRIPIYQAIKKNFFLFHYTYALNIKTGSCLYLHTIPYTIVLIMLGRFASFALIYSKHHSVLSYPLFNINILIAGIAIGLATWIVSEILWVSIDSSNLIRKLLIGFISSGVIIFLLHEFLSLTNKTASVIAIGSYLLFLIYWEQAKILYQLNENDGMRGGIAVSVGFGLAGGIVWGLGPGTVNETVFGITLGIIIGLISHVDLFRTILGSIFFWLASFYFTFGANYSIVTAIAFAITLAIIFLCFHQLIHYVYIFTFTFFNPQNSWYSYHPIFWERLAFLPYFRLPKLLVEFAERDPKANSEIDRLLNYSSFRRNAALYAKIVLLVRNTAKTTDLSRLGEILEYLPDSEQSIFKHTARRKDWATLGQTTQVRGWVTAISHLQTRLNTIPRPAFREPTAELLVKEIENFRHRVVGLHEPLASEFRAAATQWLAIAERQLEEARRGATRRLTPQVFRAGDPVDREQEAFVLRYAVIGELEQQIMLSTGCPGIVLYGRRRMGKSTILRNLTDFLPTNVTPVVVSMQRPEMFASVGSLTGFVSRELRAQFDGAGGGNAEVSDLTGFFQTLKTVNDRLEDGDKRLLLGVDEYETIDKKVGEGVFPLELLDTIRESIQSHRRITWVFAGSHEITELQHAAWTSYLVSARTIEVPFFTLAETRLLLTDPVKHSTLWRNNPDKRPRFDASFWGEDGIERIQAEAGGWPHLVQLIAETIVDLLNTEEQAATVTPALMEQALDKAVVRGHNVLYELLHRESFLSGEWNYLLNFRKTETQSAPQDEKIAASLRRRLLISEENGEWRLRVPLMARWLKQRGQ